MRKSPVNAYSLKWSCGLHGLLLFSAAIIPLLPHSRPREIQLITEFTVVLEENLIEPATVSPSPTPMPEPQRPKPEPMPEPKPPEKLPEPKDVIPIEPIKKPQEKKPDPPKKPEPPPKREFVRSTTRVERPVSNNQQDFTKLKPVTEKKLTPAEIRKLLDDGAKPGTRNQIPQDEISRCYSLIVQALYNAWAQPGSAGGNPVATLEIRFDSTGRIISYRITKSSGDAHYDQTVLKAAANCPPIRGLTQGFLKQYDKLTVEFKLH